MKLAEYTPSSDAWRKLAPWLLLIAALLLLFRETALAMVSIWNRSDTFAHAFLVPPIVLWLVWRRRDTLATIPMKSAPWMLLPMAATCGLWLLGELAGVNAATQFALVALLVLSVPAVFGLQMARALTFPLLFLFFSVPVGDFMVQPMMNWTADFAAAAVRLSGVPLYREGLQFVIPSGSWSVVEACSGVRYLIASFMVGTLFAYLNFQSNTRRFVFIMFSLLVPILANWVRAYLIVMVGHLSDNKIAAGVDHIIYGWVFFGIVIGVMFLVGSRWAEPEPEAPGVSAARSGVAAGANGPASTPAFANGSGVWGVGIAAVLLLVLVQAAMWQLNRPHSTPLPVISIPERLEGGWLRSNDSLSTWVPNYSNAAVTEIGSYRSGSAAVGVWVGYYRDQGYSRKMVTSSNDLVEAESTSNWARTSRGSAALSLAGMPLAIRTADLRGSADINNSDAQRLRVWQVYWVGGYLTTSDVRARLQVALNRLLGKGDDAATLIFYTPLRASASGSSDAAGQDAQAVLQSFVPAILPSLQTNLAKAAAPR